MRCHGFSSPNAEPSAFATGELSPMASLVGVRLGARRSLTAN
jgi:hypothetical protein